MAQNSRSTHASSRPVRRTVNPHETGSSGSTPTFGSLARDAVASIPDALSSMATATVNEITGQNTDYSSDYDESSPDGGVRIPTFEEYKAQQEAKNNQFFYAKQQEESAARARAEAEEQKKLDAIYEQLDIEIKRFEAVHKQMDENIEKLKKLVIADRTNKYKKGVYAFTTAEIGRLIMKTALINASHSNNWLELLMTKRNKRGSMYSARSQKQGTQYSKSQELTITRSVQ